MAKLKVVIGNVDIQSDDPKAVAQIIRNLVGGLLNIELGEPEPPTQDRQLKPGRNK